MCGRYAVSASAEWLAEFYQAVATGDIPAPNFNVAPTQLVPAILIPKGEPVTSPGRILTGLRWGLVPSWTKVDRGAGLINARAETITEKPSFRAAFATRRCLLPCDGYFEWTTTPGVGKQPWFIHSDTPGGLAMAGVYEHWRRPDGSWLTTTAVITTAATGELTGIHDRRPVFVAGEHQSEWLDPASPDTALVLLDEPAHPLKWHQVSTRVNTVANNSAQLLLPLDS